MSEMDSRFSVPRYWGRLSRGTLIRTNQRGILFIVLSLKGAKVRSTLVVVPLLDNADASVTGHMALA